MIKEKEWQHIKKYIVAGDSVVDYFNGLQTLILLQILIFGPLALFIIRRYLVVVSSQGVCVKRSNLFGMNVNCVFYRYDDIECVERSQNVIQTSLCFNFNDGKKVKVNASGKSAKKAAAVYAVVKENIENKPI
jgi:hypothetical protein